MKRFDPYYEWFCTDCKRAEECRLAAKPLCKTFTHYDWRDGVHKSWQGRFAPDAHLEMQYEDRTYCEEA